MDSRVRGEELLDATENRLEHARRSCSVERDIRAFMAVDARHEHAVTDERSANPSHHPSFSRRHKVEDPTPI